MQYVSYCVSLIEKFAQKTSICIKFCNYYLIFACELYHDINMNYKIGDISVLMHSVKNKKLSRSWSLIYSRVGSGIYMYDGKLRSLDESEILLLPPCDEISFDSDIVGDEYNASVDAVVIRFDEQWMDSLLRVFPSCSDVILSLKELRAPSLVTGLKWLKISDLMNRISEVSSCQESVIVLQILQLLAESSDIHPISGRVLPIPETAEKLSKIDRYISCNLHRKFSLDDIAAYVGMNRTYFCLFFKKHYSISLTDHVNKLRIDMACTMLNDGKSTVAEVAAACGFPTVTYFNRIFKKIKGVTPRDFRSQESPLVL